MLRLSVVERPPHPGPSLGVAPAELEFYEPYDWCLSPHLTSSEALDHLNEEVNRLRTVPSGWQTVEVATNIFLLSCAVLNCVDEYIRGAALRLPTALANNVAGRGATRVIEALSTRRRSDRAVLRWRERWSEQLNEYLSLLVAQSEDRERLSCAASRLVLPSRATLPRDLLRERLGSPTTFSRLDLTHHDIIGLGRRFVKKCPERTQDLLIVGLRTSGSYFAPLLRALFGAEGYQRVRSLTIEPNKGVGVQESRALKRFAKLGFLALIVDDPPYTNRTVLAALDAVTKAGFIPARIKVMAPTHSAKPNWSKWLPEASIITLPPKQWYKRNLLDTKTVEDRLKEYFRGWNVKHVSINPSDGADVFNGQLQNLLSDRRGERLKRVFEVQIETASGKRQVKYVLAKSVGWGWYAYHAFLIGHRLSGHVPPVLGMRDGILYMEWIPQAAGKACIKRSNLIASSASYVAARTRHLKLTGDKVSGLDLKRSNNGYNLLEKVLSRAYGPALSPLLMRSRLGKKLREQSCPVPTLIDGNMRSSEWLLGSDTAVKVDYEHHGMGKAGLNLTDPAYDLADTILNLALSAEEEGDLIGRYVKESGDSAVKQRLPIYKVLAGLWTMNEVQEQLLSSPRGAEAQRLYHQRFMSAWHFLTVQTASYCGAHCRVQATPRWSAPLIVLDVDGVLDRRLFGFPCTTAAGIEALSLLHEHRLTTALNTARSVSEVKHYCEAYSLAGAVAEHGAYLWDAVRQQERVLLSAETITQLKELRRRLQQVPGVFLDERYQYSIRALTYREKPLGLIQSLFSEARASSIGDGAIGPISTHILHQLMADLHLDRLTFHHTPLDTAIVAKEADKGTGLVALRDWVLSHEVETIAVGDSDADLAMFRAATRSFAPANIGCKRQARFLGCNIASHSNQTGLLEIIRKIVEGEGHHDYRRHDTPTNASHELLLSVLRDADTSWAKHMFVALSDPRAYNFFVRF